MEVPQKKKIELPHNPTIPVLGIYLEKNKKTSSKICIHPIFIAVLFTIAKLWKQPPCLSTDKWKQYIQ